MSVLGELLGDSPGVRAVRDRVGRLLDHRQEVRRLPPILIQGETGTGKGLLARIIHRAGPRPDGPFVDVNCAAIPETLLEAEMFGFERGAFTDARRAKPGLLQTAHRGTIFLDEIGLLPEALQIKLLKVLEERSVRRLGATQGEPIDVWILSATNEDLLAAIRQRRFREDLYHRLAVLTVTLPPLRERGGDILKLAEYFLARTCADYGVAGKVLAPDARAALLAHPWPGNVRELSNVIERAVLLSAAAEVTAETLGLVEAGSGWAASRRGEAPTSLDGAMREHLVETLGRTGWNISRTASLLGISRNTLRARMGRYGLRDREGARKPLLDRRSATGPARPPAAAPVSPGPGPIAPPPPSIARRWERRRLALLRVALVPPEGSDMSLETARALDVVVEKTRTFGGRVEGISPTGIMAVFGLDAPGDAAPRAAHAALAILKAAERGRREDGNETRVRIGLHAGQVQVGVGAGAAELSMDERRDLWSVLDELIERAPLDGVAVSAAAAPLLARRFDLPEGPGPESGAHTHLLVGLDRTGLGLGGHTGLFFGRRHELDLLRSRLQLAMAGQGQIVGIVGDAGIGKSRLVFELRQTLSAHELTYLEAHCHAYGSEMPYLPVLELLRGLCGIADLDTPEAVRGKVEAILAETDLDAPSSAPYLLHLLGVKPGTELIADLPPDVIKPRILDALRQLMLRRSRRRPLVIVVDDLQWIDPASEEYLSSLADVASGARLMLLATYRPGHRPRWIERSYATQVALQPLVPEDSRGLLLSALGGADRLEAALEARILAKAEGNPFFIEELARTVRGRSEIEPALTIPDTIQDVLLARIDQLRAEDRHILQVASVVDKHLSAELLAAASGLTQESIAASLGRLTRAEFLVDSPGAAEGDLAFRHALIQEVAYETVSESRRRAVDTRVVEAMERLHAGRLEQHVERLGHHAFRGELWDRAVDYLRRAGLKAAARSAHREAALFFERAMLAAGRLAKTREALDQAIDLRLDLKTSLTPLAEYGRLGEILREAEAVAESIGDRRRLGRISAYVSDYYRLMGDQERAVAAGLRALGIARAAADFNLEVTTNAYLGLAHYTRGEHRRAAEVFRMNVARLVGDVERQSLGMILLPAVHSRVWLVACLAELGEFDEAIARADEALGLAESAKHPFSVAGASFAVGYAALRRGEGAAAVPALEKGLGLAREWNIGLWLPTIGAALGVAYLLAGRVDDAVPVLEQAVEREVAMRRVGSHSARLVALSEGYLAAGRTDAALATAGRAVDLARGHGERGYEAGALRMLGLCRAAGAQIDAAADAYAEAVALAQSLELLPLLGQCHLAAGALERRRGCLPAAREHLGRARALFRALEMRLWLERTEVEGRALASV